jgi:hypothetical protein
MYEELRLLGVCFGCFFTEHTCKIIITKSEGSAFRETIVSEVQESLRTNIAQRRWKSTDAAGLKPVLRRGPFYHTLASEVYPSQ